MSRDQWVSGTSGSGDHWVWGPLGLGTTGSGDCRSLLGFGDWRGTSAIKCQLKDVTFVNMDVIWHSVGQGFKLTALFTERLLIHSPLVQHSHY